MARVVPETSEPVAAADELARLMATEERLSVATREARREADARLSRARSAAAESADREARALAVAVEALRDRIGDRVAHAREATEAERERRLTLYRSVTDDRLRTLADSVLAELTG